MVDTIDREKRSETMAKVRSKNTGPELIFRHALFAEGLRYRLHVKALPGNPDLIFPKFRAAIFVHGCFWHWHGCPRSRMPSTNTEYWKRKISRNQIRDKENIIKLKSLGWRVLIVWECALNKSEINNSVAKTIIWLKERPTDLYEIYKTGKPNFY